MNANLGKLCVSIVLTLRMNANVVMERMNGHTCKVLLDTK